MGTDNNGIYFHFLFLFINRGAMTSRIRLSMNWLNHNLYFTTGTPVRASLKFGVDKVQCRFGRTDSFVNFAVQR